MWTKLTCTVVALVFSAVLATAYALYSMSQERLFSLITRSPDRSYEVHLREIANLVQLPSVKYTEHVVRFSVLKESKVVVEEPLYSTDGDDRRFADAFPSHSWVASNTLRFGDTNVVPPSHCDEVLILNDTAQTMTYLQVETGRDEMFLLLDLQPRSLTKLCTQPQTDQRGDISWLGLTGKFASNVTVSNGMNFRVRGKYKRPAHYCVRVTDDKVAVSSQEFEGFQMDTFNSKTTVPPVANCNP